MNKSKASSTPIHCVDTGEKEVPVELAKSKGRKRERDSSAGAAAAAASGWRPGVAFALCARVVGLLLLLPSRNPQRTREGKCLAPDESGCHSTTLTEPFSFPT